MTIAEEILYELITYAKNKSDLELEDRVWMVLDALKEDGQSPVCPMGDYSVTLKEPSLDYTKHAFTEEK